MEESHALLSNQTSTNVSKRRCKELLCCCCTPHFSSVHEKYSFRDYVVRLRYSPIYSFYAILMILFCAFLLFWSIFRTGISELWFICLEGIVTTCLCIEVSITFCIQKCSRFFRAFLNWVDLICVACCCITFLLLVLSFIYTYVSTYYIDYVIIEEEVLSIIQDVLVIIHSIVNTIRLIIFVLQQRKNPNLQRKLKLDSVNASPSHSSTFSISSSLTIPSSTNPFEARYGSFAQEKQETNMLQQIHVLSPRK